MTPRQIATALLRSVREHCGVTRELCADCRERSRRAAEWQARDAAAALVAEWAECMECGNRPARWDSVLGCHLCDRCAADLEAMREEERA